MRRFLAVGLALLAGAPLGCLPTRTTPTEARPPSSERDFGGDDLIVFCVAVIERPAGDYSLNHDIWQLADEQSLTAPEGPDVELRRKQALVENGFRIGQVGGLLPSHLQNMIESGRCCAPPQLLRRKAGDAAPIVLAPARPLCRFRLSEEDGSVVELTQAQCELEVTATPISDSRIRLRCTPRVRHGDTDLTPHPVREPGGTIRWDLQTQQRIERYAGLAWEMTVGADEVVLVGTLLDRPETLGQCCFLRKEGEAPRQRLLVLRAVRENAAPLSDEVVARSGGALALQATQSATPPPEP
jgi:hypothetical protein